MWQQPPNFKRFVKDGCLVFGKKMVILDSGGNYLYVKEVAAASFTKIGAPYSIVLPKVNLGADGFFLVL